MHCSFLRNSDGNLNIAYLYRNDNGRWNVNFNRVSNDWNSNNRLPRCKSLYSLPLDGGVSFLSIAIQPPSIVPIFTSFCDNCVYFVVSKPFASHKIVIKYLRLSNFLLNSSRKISLLSFFAPSVWRVNLGTRIKKLCHNK